MKIKFENDTIIVYLYNQILTLDNKDTLTVSIKELLIKLVTIYHLKLSGIFEVVIYENENYGYILDIVKIKDFEYSDYIDIKLEIKKNSTFYLQFDNYNYIEKNHEIRCLQNKFYVNIDEYIDVNKVIEFVNIIYKDETVRKIDNVNNKIHNVN